MAAKINLLPQFNPSITHPLYLIRNRLLRSLQRNIPKLSGRVLDFGCGLKPYESLFTVSEYIGVDYVGEGETYSKEKVDFVYDGKTLPFENESFDCIFCTEVAEHLFNLDDIAREWNRVLKTGGSILLTCPFTMPEHEVPNDFARYTSFALFHILKQNGFEVVHYEKTGNFVESVFQLWIIYLDQSILRFFRKIPVLRSVMRYATYTGGNAIAIFFSWLLPNNKTLYLNNVLLAKKTAG